MPYIQLGLALEKIWVQIFILVTGLAGGPGQAVISQPNLPHRIAVRLRYFSLEKVQGATMIDHCRAWEKRALLSPRALILHGAEETILSGFQLLACSWQQGGESSVCVCGQRLHLFQLQILQMGTAENLL